MNKGIEESIERLKKLKNELTGLPLENVTDDGRDSGDEHQNRAFELSINKQERLIAEIAGVEFGQGYGEKLDEIWDALYSGLDDTPEGRYNHAIRYIDAVIDYFDKQGKSEAEE